MNPIQEVSINMDKIREVFEYAQNLVESGDDLKTIIAKLEDTDNEFRSIAYESVSMGIALNDLSKGDSLTSWLEFTNVYAQDHLALVHAGLGWAIAQNGRPALALLEQIDPIMRSRVIDGIGYYNGIFRQRQSIKLLVIPAEYQNKLSGAFDRGIGRSIWYICKGDIENVHRMIQGFPADRHTQLWRGLGVATAFVGGCNEEVLKSLFSASGEHQAQLATGAILATKNRMQANALTKDIELTCKTWCNLTADEAMELANKAEQNIDVDRGDIFEICISNIEKELFHHNQTINQNQ